MRSPSDPATAAVLLDVDGTLVDSTYHHAVAWRRAFDRVGVPVALWRVHRAIGMGGDRLVSHVAGADIESAHGDTLRRAWAEEYAGLLGEVRPLPGAADLVHGLAAAGYRVALASSGTPEFTAAAVRLLGAAADHVDVVTTSEDVDASKPEPDLLSTTLDRLAAGARGRVRSAVLVGDTPYDVEAAERAGIGCVAVRTGGFARAELAGAGAAHVADDLTALHDLDWDAYLRCPAVA